MTSPKTGQHDFFENPIFDFKSSHERQKMPLNLGSANHCRDLSCVEDEGLLLISPTDLRLTESAKEFAGKTLRRRKDVGAVIVLQETSLLSKLFAEAWKTLPSRLASLAVCPPAATFVVPRADNSARLMRQAVSRNQFPEHDQKTENGWRPSAHGQQSRFRPSCTAPQTGQAKDFG